MTPVHHEVLLEVFQIFALFTSKSDTNNHASELIVLAVSAGTSTAVCSEQIGNDVSLYCAVVVWHLGETDEVIYMLNDCVDQTHHPLQNRKVLSLQ